jgi:hypothetical protein
LTAFKSKRPGTNSLEPVGYGPASGESWPTENRNQRAQSPEFGQAAEEREAADIGDVIGVPDKEDLAGHALPLMLSHILYIFESNVRS